MYSRAWPWHWKICWLKTKTKHTPTHTPTPTHLHTHKHTYTHSGPRTHTVGKVELVEFDAMHQIATTLRLKAGDLRINKLPATTDKNNQVYCCSSILTQFIVVPYRAAAYHLH